MPQQRRALLGELVNEVDSLTKNCNTGHQKLHTFKRMDVFATSYKLGVLLRFKFSFLLRLWRAVENGLVRIDIISHCTKQHSTHGIPTCSIPRDRLGLILDFAIGLNEGLRMLSMVCKVRE